MKALDFKEVINLINHSRNTEIEGKPIIQDDGKWALYKGEHRVPNFRYNFRIIYLFSDATKESIIKAIHILKNIIPSGTPTQIVYAPSLSVSIKEDLRKMFKSYNISSFNDLKAYLFSFIQDQLGDYTNKLKQLKPEFFVQPQYETPSGIVRKVPNPMYSFLTDDTEDLKDGALGILLAEPGQGKTYTTKYLAWELLDKNQIPIYIHSPQWFNMREEDLSSLYKTITHSFRYFNTPIDWIEDIEEEFINTSLRLGIFRIIFDGFDEYILWNKGKITAQDIVKQLHTLSEQSNSRILVTSRTSFWNENFNESRDKLPHLFKYKIQPFDINHAKNYFKIRFPNSDKSSNQAIEVFGKLKNTGNSDFSNSFAGRGFILSLIADLFSSNSESTTYDGSSSILQWIMSSLCLREEKRQKLPINSTQQLTIFRNISEQKAIGGKINNELLILIIMVVCDKLTEPEISSLVGDSKKRGKLQDHPLLSKDPKTELWGFKHEQIEYNLLVEQILNYIESENLKSLINLFEKLYFGGSLLDDLSTVILEQLYNKNGLMDPFEKQKMLINKLLSTTDLYRINPKKYNNVIVFTTRLLMNVLLRTCPIGETKEKRMNTLFSILESNLIVGLQFTGTVQSINFSNVHFDNCRFENVTFANCDFNSRTTFQNCFFNAGLLQHCNGISESVFTHTEFTNEAKAMISYEKINHGFSMPTRDDIMRDIEIFIKRFIQREGLFRTIMEEQISKGLIGQAPYKDVFILVLKKYIIESHTVSHGSGFAFNIRANATESLNYFLNNNIFSGELAKAYNEICRKLKI